MAEPLLPGRQAEPPGAADLRRRAGPATGRLNAICNWIHDNVDYVGGISDEMTSAFDTATQRAGVCRDFAHLAIAMCRALGIPARYVSAYAHRLDPPDFHAVIEAYLQGPSGMGWYLFDPTRKAAPDGLVRIGIGRDAAEVAFATPFGTVDYDKPEVWIRAKDAAPGGGSRPRRSGRSSEASHREPRARRGAALGGPSRLRGRPNCRSADGSSRPTAGRAGPPGRGARE